MDMSWVVLTTALLAFCFASVTLYRRGYKAGARMVLVEWKKVNDQIDTMGDDDYVREIKDK